jgi:hypothetical protein
LPTKAGDGVPFHENAGMYATVANLLIPACAITRAYAQNESLRGGISSSDVVPKSSRAPSICKLTNTQELYLVEDSLLFTFLEQISISQEHPSK